jgi:exopolysaccharide biosynthesis polyprenyl glycosylphosphotransferase
VRSIARAYQLRLHITDFLVIAIAVTLACASWLGLDSPQRASPTARSEFLAVGGLVILAWACGLSVFQTRERYVLAFGATEYKRIISATTTTFGVLAIAFLVAQMTSSRWFFLIALPLGLVGLVASRWGWRKWLAGRQESSRSLSRAIVVGRASDIEPVVAQIISTMSAAYTISGVVIPVDTEMSSAFASDISVASDLSRSAEFAKELGVDAVIVVGQPGESSDFIRDLAWQLEGSSAHLILAMNLMNIAGPRIHFRPVDGMPLMHVELPQFEGTKHVLKRVLDVVCSAAAMLVLSPVFLVIAWLVRRSSDGGALFTQERVGQNGSTFQIYKFRSMVANAPQMLGSLAEKNEGSGALFKLKDDPRVTPIGRHLRKYSLDELPQLWNVFTGDMSLVGPRPPLPHEVVDYEHHVRRRLYIKPGLTGMWQISGRSNLSWEESVRLDLYYVENWSVIGDLVIMWRTLRVLIKPVGAY